MMHLLVMHLLVSLTTISFRQKWVGLHWRLKSWFVKGKSWVYLPVWTSPMSTTMKQWKDRIEIHGNWNNQTRDCKVLGFPFFTMLISLIESILFMYIWTDTFTGISGKTIISLMNPLILKKRKLIVLILKYIHKLPWHTCHLFV